MNTKYIVIGSLGLVVIVVIFYLIMKQQGSFVNAPTNVKSTTIGDVLSGNSVEWGNTTNEKSK